MPAWADLAVSVPCSRLTVMSACAPCTWRVPVTEPTVVAPLLARIVMSPATSSTRTEPALTLISPGPVVRRTETAPAETLRLTRSTSSRVTLPDDSVMSTDARAPSAYSEPVLPRSSDPAGSSTVMSAVPAANGSTYCFHEFG